MGDGGFATDTDQLRKGAKTYLGNLIEDLEAAQRVLQEAGNFTDAFRGQGSLFNGITGFWDDTHHYVLRVLADNTENIRLSQQALVEIADRYDQDDQSGAEGMPG
ncbi:hypothetical protein [Saccharopolyspora taberi]|uniref:WXG100 family type VII secretion target n=1 Tax=Saccharopolyspora taberi TaxID=60895 RepID=A0ABN3VN05_9PSEU